MSLNQRIMSLDQRIDELQSVIYQRMAMSGMYFQVFTFIIIIIIIIL